MKCLAYVFFALFLNSMSFAQEFLPPFAEMPFSTGVKDRTTNQPLPDGNWAFNVTIRNPNPRAVYCKNTAFLAHLSTFEEACTKADYFTYVRSAESVTGFVIPANDKVNFPEAGDSERLLKKAEMGGTEVVYCGREALNLECGYTCDGGHNPGDDWTESAVWGSAKYACLKGQVSKVELLCSSGYSLNDARTECLPSRCGSHEHGSLWTEATGDGIGTRHLICDFGVAKTKDISCPVGFVKAENGCFLNCDRTPHGEHFYRDVPFGRVNLLCYNGAGVTPSFECSYGNVSGENCPAPKNCSYALKLPDSTINHGGKWLRYKICQGNKLRQWWLHCENGTLVDKELLFPPPCGNGGPGFG